MPAEDESATKGTAPATLSAPDQADVQAIDGAVERMRAATAPDPYILTVPQDVEPRYHHAYRYQATQWLHQAPFQWQEGELTQYQTFFYHEHGRNMYVLHSSSGPSEDGERSKGGTGASTPTVGPKKKISLDAYKKQKTGTPVQDVPAAKPPEALVKQAVVKGPVDRVKAETEEVLAAVVEEEPLLEREKDAPVHRRVEPGRKELDRKELKRKRDDEDDKQGQPENAPPVKDAPAAKKPRPASPKPATLPAVAPSPSAPSETAKTSEKPATSPLAETARDLDLPPKLSPLRTPSLPPRLSPTVPSNIAKTLKAKGQLKPVPSDTSAPNSATKNGRLTPVRKPEGITKRKSPVPRNGFRANSSSPAVRSDVEDRAPPPRTSAAVQQKGNTPESSRDDEIVVARVLKGRRPEKLSLVVKLKIKKQKNQRDALRILNMRPKPSQTVASPPSPGTATSAEEQLKPDRPPTVRKRDPTAKGVAQKVGPAITNSVAKKQDDKRSTTERPLVDRDDGHPDDSSKEGRASGAKSPEPSPAKPKIPHDAEARKKDLLRTPVKPEHPDSSLDSPSASMSRQVTPMVRRDHLMSAAMKRERSGESNHADTPSAKSTRTPTNNVLPQLNGSGKSTLMRTAAQRSWETEQKRLEALGKELKHTSSAHLQRASQSDSDLSGQQTEKQLAAIKAIESLLAFVLAFTCADQAALAADPKQTPSVRNWRSLHGFYGFVKHQCESFPLLLGLTCSLGVAYNARIIELAAERREREAPDTYAPLLKAATEAEAILDVDALQGHFPDTWSGRARDTLPADKLSEPGRLGDGGYKLPVGVQTSPIRAARAGYAMLREWIVKQQGVEYELKLKL